MVAEANGKAEMAMPVADKVKELKRIRDQADAELHEIASIAGGNGHETIGTAADLNGILSRTNHNLGTIIGKSKKIARAAKSPAGSSFERIKAALAEGAALTVKDLAMKSKVSEASVRQCLYKTHPVAFTVIDQQGTRAKLLSLSGKGE